MSNIHGLNSNGGGGGGGSGGGQGGGPMMGGSMFGGGGGDKDCGTMIKEAWRSVPVFSKFLVYVCVFLYLLSWLLAPVVGLLALCPG